MENKVQGYNDEMEMGNFLEDVYRGITQIRTAVWLLVALEAAKFVLW